MQNNVNDRTHFNKNALLHKIYGWICIAIAIVAALFVALGFSFGSLLVAYNLNDFGNAVIMSQYVGIFLTLIFGFFNLFVTKKLRENNRYALYLSLFSLILMIVFRGTVLDYLFVAGIGITWLLYFKARKFPTISNKLVFRYTAPVVALLCGYFIYTYSNTQKANDFCSAVYYAATYDELKKILDEGMNPNIQNDKGLTPLFYAKDPSKTKLLLEYGADPNYETSTKSTPLFSLMIHNETLKDYFSILVNHGADINHQDIDGDTVLHVGLSLGRKGIIESVLPHKPDLTIKNNRGMTALDIAKQQSPAQYKILLEYMEGSKGITNQSRPIKNPQAAF